MTTVIGNGTRDSFNQTGNSTATEAPLNATSEKVAELRKQGLMEAEGLAIFKARDRQKIAQTAYEQNQPLYLANAAKELFAAANKEGLGRLDFAAIHQFLASK